MSTSRALRNAALDYADRGWCVLPLQPRGKPPLGQLVPHGKDDATSDLATVLRWWTARPDANIGIVGRPSGLVILDVDPRNGGDDDLFELELELGRLPDTVRAETGGGGEHYFFLNPGVDLVGKAGTRDGIDVQDHKYVLASPSVHPSGRPYAWDLAPGDVAVAELPEAWLAALKPSMSRRVVAPVAENHSEPLRNVLAAEYVPRLANRTLVDGCWCQCPFHKGGAERTPSLKVNGTLWACFGCAPIGGRRVMGGNIFDFGALLLGMPIPPRGPDFLELKQRLGGALGVAPS